MFNQLSNVFLVILCVSFLFIMALSSYSFKRRRIPVKFRIIVIGLIVIQTIILLTMLNAV